MTKFLKRFSYGLAMLVMIMTMAINYGCGPTGPPGPADGMFSFLEGEWTATDSVTSTVNTVEFQVKDFTWAVDKPDTAYQKTFPVLEYEPRWLNMIDSVYGGVTEILYEVHALDSITFNAVGFVRKNKLLGEYQFWQNQEYFVPDGVIVPYTFIPVAGNPPNIRYLCNTQKVV